MHRILFPHKGRIVADERNYQNGSDGVAEEQSTRPVTGWVRSDAVSECGGAGSGLTAAHLL
ncbi:hypothetical protein Rhow_008998 [Rhodococcus wratislaviensis]|uniref:Uncharacterized protein n=1 Tax=Rhodococcus wratislaviensis TaxID=44752 RepID=A0A402CLS1_RHOWR|nr:hypothetical protein Rhow_008998 [Rhodococcus wratislaviensis]